MEREVGNDLYSQNVRNRKELKDPLIHTNPHPYSISHMSKLNLREMT